MNLKKIGLILGASFLLATPKVINEVNAQDTNHKVGVASFYNNKFEGRKTASGEIFKQQHYTCASNHYALGSYLKVTNLANKKVVYVKVNDRMGHPTRVIDLTYLAAKDLNFVNSGTTKVKIEVVPLHEGKRQIFAQLNGDVENVPNNVGNQL